ncbi:hypothetical protein [Vulcanisaeta distributa]|uniref:Uncharacterized protein n=1 Tax=Vulcanisaeta distributa (strain DSM 14429 / JCM 11212 / NBRC 100878 / IC-017) TaxID=572478 RepID=E1QRE4_VULDI|nr:hypothetical protein [Vulcanisaeta distributa]ADN50641.1 conserved hypothetical protein [Vulcanisaeta distributa DSM 14429]
MGKKVIYKEIEITNERISRLKYALLLLLIALIGTGAYILTQYSLQHVLHNAVLSSYLSIPVGAVVVGVGLILLNRYLINHGVMIPILKRRVERTVFISPGNGWSIDEELIRRHEDALRFADRDSEGYVTGLAMLSFMYLQNAIAYDDRSLYLKARDYLNRAKDAMRTVNVSDEVKILVERLEKEVEGSRSRFE